MKIPNVQHQPWKPSGASPWREPRPWGWFPGLVRLIGGAYIRGALGLEQVTLQRQEVLLEAVAGTQSRGDRVLLVFRHCGDADPQGLWYALNRLAKGRFRVLFLASAEIALWGGPLAALALRASGALPLAHGIGSRPALDYLRRHFRQSPDPVALAPEGQITYELEGPILLDPGAANMALWAAAAATGDARMVPLGVRYRCPRETWVRWGRFLTTLETSIGLDVWKGEGGAVTARDRLNRVWDQLLTTGETYYRRNHRREMPPLEGRGDRCRRLFLTSLELAALVRGIPLGPDPRAVLFQLRSSAMDLVFPRPRNRSRLGRYLEARGASEGWWINRHQDLADLLQALNPDEFPAVPTLDRAVEAALNLADFAGRLAGGHVDHRPRYFRRVLEITVGDPWTVAKPDGRSHRAQAAEVTEKIRHAFENLAREP